MYKYDYIIYFFFSFLFFSSLFFFFSFFFFKGHNNDSAKKESMQNDYNDEMIETKEDNKNEVFVLKNKKCIQPELKCIDENKVEMCLCFDNRGSTNKIKKKEIINIIHFSYFLITRIFLYEKKGHRESSNKKKKKYVYIFICMY